MMNMANEELRKAYYKCCQTYVGSGPCYDREYLVARHKYHELLVAVGKLDPKLAEKKPK